MTETMQHIPGSSTRWMCGKFRTEPIPWMPQPPITGGCERCMEKYRQQRERARERRAARTVHKCPDCRCGR